MENNNANTATVPEFNLNRATEATDDQIDDIMAYHAWDEEKVAKGQIVRTVLGAAMKAIIQNVPPSPDRSAAIRKLREARMDCNSAITHNGKY